MRNEGFTLLETIIAIGIMTMALVGILGILSTSISVGKDIRLRHIAVNLAQEGVEVVHNIRNTNWVEQQETPTTAWDDGLTDGTSCVQYDSTALISSCANPLLFDSALGVYTYTLGTATQFSRTITLSGVLSPFETDSSGIRFIKVISTVTWEGKTISAENHLYDWK